jgi:hypothetical protein
MYAVAVLARSGVGATATAGLTVAVTSGSWWRLAQIWLDLRKLDRAVRALNPPVAATPGGEGGDPHE